MKNKLTWVSVGVSLASIHYGLGFLVGSGEAIFNQGSIGIIYAVSSALGIFSLIFIAPFYLKMKYPIWDLMGKRYGHSVRKYVAFLSGVWMIGIIASQILGGSGALTLLGINKHLSMIILSVLTLGIAIMEIGKLSKIFFYMLIFSSLTLILILLNVGIEWIPVSLSSFSGSISRLTFSDFIGTILTTILVTFIGMDFHQFLVQAKTSKAALKGVAFGGGILLVLSVLLLALITGSIHSNLVNNIAEAKQVVPFLLLNFGNNLNPSLGIIFLLPVIFVSIGSGGGVTRIVAKTISDLNIIPKRKIDSRVFTVIAAFTIALTGSSIINLIVSFYAIYVASVFVPFLLYLLDVSKKIKVSPIAIQNSIVGGFLGSLFVFINRFIPGSFLAENQATYIMVSGLVLSVVFYFVTSFLNKKPKEVIR